MKVKYKTLGLFFIVGCLINLLGAVMVDITNLLMTSIFLILLGSITIIVSGISAFIKLMD